MASRGHTMGEIEHWRNEALTFARSDNLGNLLKTSLELMNSVIMSGLHSETLPLKVEALRMECASVQENDPIRNDDSRMLHYGVTSTMCSLFTSLRGKNEAESGLSVNQHVEKIEQWRNKAHHFSRSDKLGQLIKGTLELMQTVIATGLRTQTLPLKIKALSMECESAMADDPNSEDGSRSLHYGEIFAICTLLEALTATEQAAEIIKAPIRGVRKVRFEIEEDDFVPPSCIFNFSPARDDSSSMDATNRGTDIQERRLLEITSPEDVEPFMAETTDIINDTRHKSEEEKPSLTYRKMIVDALESSETKQLSNAQICRYICDKYAYYRAKPETVEKSVSSCLSKHFRSVASGHTMWRMYYRQKGSQIQEKNPMEREEPDISIADNDTTLESEGERPQLPYREMIIYALNNSETKQLSTAEICEYICNKYPHYRDKVEALEKSINRCLSKHFRPIVSGLTMWRMYYKHKTNTVQEQSILETTDDEEPPRKKGRMAHHSINETDPVPSMNNNTRSTEHDWMNAVDMTNFGESISPIMDQQVRNANLPASALSFADHSSASVISQADEVTQLQPPSSSSTTTFFDCAPPGIDQNDSRMEHGKADAPDSEITPDKPSKTHREIIIDILKSSPSGYLSAGQILQCIRDQYPFYVEKYTKQTMKYIVGSILSRNFQKINTNNNQALWTIPSEDNASHAIFEESTSELPKNYRYQIEEALKSSEIGRMTSMEISQYICEKYPTKCNAYDLRQRFSSCLFKHFKKTIADSGNTLWSIRSEEERRISSVIDGPATPVSTKRERGASTKDLEMSSIRAYSPEL